MDALDALEVVTAELNRLAALARTSDDYRAALAIARELERHGATGSRRATWACPLARHLSRRSGARVGVTRHEVVIADSAGDRKSTRLNSSHVKISYAVFCLKKKKQRNL